MILIWGSNYFAQGGCYQDDYYNGHPVQELKNRKWRRRFNQVDRAAGIDPNLRDGMMVEKPYSTDNEIVGEPEHGCDVLDYMAMRGYWTDDPLKRPDLSGDKYYLKWHTDKSRQFCLENNPC
jgi:hypothetical protein